MWPFIVGIVHQNGNPWPKSLSISTNEKVTWLLKIRETGILLGHRGAHMFACYYAKVCG